VDEYKATYPMELKFDYTFKALEPPFNVAAIYHDAKFTYIKS
jgi:type IV secretion system protein VirB9